MVLLIYDIANINQLIYNWTLPLVFRMHCIDSPATLQYDTQGSCKFTLFFA